jgi:tRNA1(Val) A37 N6-methylase TrmN6
MSGIQMGNFITVAQKFDFSKYKKLVDVGGSAGLLSLMVAKPASYDLHHFRPSAC